MLDFALRAQAQGHVIKWFIRRVERTKDIGRGCLHKPSEFVEVWQDWMRWADVVFMADNTKYLRELDAWRERGVRIVGASSEASTWELDRNAGQAMFKKCGMQVAQHKEFTKYDDAINYVKKEGRAFVSKPCGDETDKSLTYVSQSPADMVFMLQRWKEQKRHKGPFILQECVKGTEMAVGAWFGPHGFNRGWHENWEFKKLMAGDTGPACFTPDTEVLTYDGWKFWPDVTMADQLCTLENGYVRYAKPSKLVAEPFKGKMIAWSNRYADIVVTPGHNMYVQDDHYRQPFFFESAVVTATMRRTFMRGGGEWQGTSGPTPAYAALVGAHIADGYCEERALRFGNCPPHKQKVFIEIAEAAGYTAKMYGPDLYVNSKELAQDMRPLGLSHEKYVPQNIKDAPIETIKAFLYGYGAGDGSRRKSNLVYTTVSRKLADDLQELALKVGWAAGINTRDRREETHLINGYECVNQRIAYDVGISQHFTKAELSPAFCTRIPYEGKVYCATVPSHVMYVRRNGKVCWSGNTGEMGTVLQVVRQSKLAEMVLRPLIKELHRIDYVGYVDVNCIIDDKGVPWPLEFTMRPGWPTFNIQMALIEGDVAQWLMDLADGTDAQPFAEDEVAVGVVMAIPDFPFSLFTRKSVTGIPVYNVKPWMKQCLHPCELMQGTAPHNKEGSVVDLPCLVTAGDYVLVASGLGATVRTARAKAYRILKTLEVPNSPFWRPDIGGRLKDQLPTIQKMGFAKHLVF